jgi:hypothetical protein
LAAIVMVFALAGCGASKAQTVNLSGDWTAQHDADAESYMTATIDSESIHVYFYSPDDGTSALYWSGTYTAPTDPIKSGSEYSWTSDANHQQMDTALMASQDDTKEFTYKDGDLSFPFSMMGVQSTIHMNQNSDQKSASAQNSTADKTVSGKADSQSTETTDPKSGKPTSEASSEKTTDAASSTTKTPSPSINTDVDDSDLELGRTGLFVHNSDYSDEYYIEYAAEIKNPGKNYAIEFPQLQITFENEDGSIAATDTQTGFYVLPGDTVVLSSQVSVPKDSINENTKYGFSVSANDAVKASSLQIPSSSDFTISNVKESTADETRITGKLSYSYDTDIDDMIAVTALAFKDDKIVGIATTYVDAMPAGQEKAFQLDASAFPDHDDLQVYAQVW